ncbi:kynureninase [Saccharopolyspora rosea]|uniref:Aminotransferase class V-fold PLP-dependent enzyme n=1 Tax=Saccharopolyspora rosea TaxID=524884 RepID=A0ABW3FX12_9PSEU
MWTSTRPAAEALDSADELAGLRAHYNLPPGLIRLDGRSGGPHPRTTARLRRFVEHRWDLRSARPRSDADWRREARSAAAALAPLVGAAPGELNIAESTSTPLFKALIAAARLRPDRPVLAVGRDCFLTDHYVARSAAEFAGRRLWLFDGVEQLADLPADEVAVVALSHTDRFSGAVRDAGEITERIHRAGALALWDLSGSAGALDVDLHAWEADFALGCGYRYLGGGAGAPAYCFVAERHRNGSRDSGCDAAGVLHPLSGGFAEPASGLALSELRTGLSILDGVGPAALAAKTAGLVDLFLRRLRENCADACIEAVAPPDGRPHGAEVNLRHPLAQRVADELSNRGVLVEHAEPDVLRCSFAPSWLRYVDVWEATDQLHDVLHAVA